MFYPLHPPEIIFSRISYYIFVDCNNMLLLLLLLLLLHVLHSVSICRMV